MNTSGKAELQHYVPQLLLRLHASDPAARHGSEQIWCFDKKTDRIFSPNIRGILSANRFYELEFEDRVISLESSLSKLEDAVAPILQDIVTMRSVTRLTENKRVAIAAFVAVQFMRTQALRDLIKDLNTRVLEMFEARGIDPSQVKNLRRMSEEDIKRLALEMLVEAPATYAPHFLNKAWHLVAADPEDPFHLGDHPVVRQSEIGGARGIGAKGVTIYMPLSPTLCLAMTDRDFVTGVIKDYERTNRAFDLAMKRAKKAAHRAGRSFAAPPEMLRHKSLFQDGERLVRALKGGTPTPYDANIVMRVNSLQMAHAARWVVSSKNDFSLAKQMIEDDPGFRSGETFGELELAPRTPPVKAAE